MSTRATIKIKEGNCEQYIYHHHDGQPSGIGVELKNFLNGLKPFQWDIEIIVNRLLKGWMSMNGHVDNGYEWTTCQHGDEEYAYLIDCGEKTIKCYKVGWDEFDWKEEKVVEIP